MMTLLAAIAGAFTAVHRAVTVPPAEAMRPEVPTRYRRSFFETPLISRNLGTTGRMVLRNVMRHPLRAAASVFGIAFFAMSQGAVIWVFISEVFPNEVRGMGQSLGSFTHWILAAVIANVFPYFANQFGGDTVFTFFTVMMVLQLLFVWFVMPETKGRTLEEIGSSMSTGPAEVRQPS